MNLHFLYPAMPFSPGAVDEPFVLEAHAIREAGFPVFTVSIEELEWNRLVMQTPTPGSTVVYRGWMLHRDAYARIVSGVVVHDARPLTDLETYLSCHHLPNWYPTLADLTPETHVFPDDDNLVASLERLGWDAFFLKDYVKSLKTGMGSVIRDPAQATAWLDAMRQYRGTVEGGVCARRVEQYQPELERRYFVIRGQAFAQAGAVPGIVRTVAERIRSPFFSVDVALREDGLERVVEIGDGQVSDLVGWTPERFAQTWQAVAT